MNNIPLNSDHVAPGGPVRGYQHLGGGQGKLQPRLSAIVAILKRLVTKIMCHSMKIGKVISTYGLTRRGEGIAKVHPPCWNWQH